MYMNYENIKRLAGEHNIDDFTDLQELSFTNENFYNEKRDLFIIGKTSSGKTLIPQLSYQMALNAAYAENLPLPKMLFVVPYRALAAQKCDEMISFYHNRELKIVQSTGEFRQHDPLICRGEVNIAVVISEKVFLFASKDRSFLSKYDFLVLDEIGLINHSERGVTMDFILFWARYQRDFCGNPRIFALGTPFYDWTAYIDKYNFIEIKDNTRPVDLDMTAIFYSKKNIIKVEGNCDFVHEAHIMPQKQIDSLKKNFKENAGITCYETTSRCLLSEPALTDFNKRCPKTNQKCSNMIEILPKGSIVSDHIILKICKEHLKKGHQILIFINNRVKVMQLCGFLYKELKNMLPEVPSEEECRADVLKECGLESDDVFGIMEYDHTYSLNDVYYQAFKSGICFHSAAMPNELRTYVEKNFLEQRKVRIVCSTETLAFGINSSVDVVIVADLYKQEAGEIRRLTSNEYYNYVGRSGRLRTDTKLTDINGYVYTLVQQNQEENYRKIHEDCTSPKILYSMFHEDNGEFMPFYLVNLLPTNNETGMTMKQITESMSHMPGDGTIDRTQLKEKIKTALRFLIENNIVVSNRNPGRSQLTTEEQQDKYCLTVYGTRLRGFIIGREDYIKLHEAAQEYISGVFMTPNTVKFLYRLICTNHAETGLNSIFKDSNTLMDMDAVLKYIRLYANTENDSYKWLEAIDNPKRLFILAALLSWMNGDSPKHLYRNYGIHYALLSKFAQQIGYLIEIVNEMIPYILENITNSKPEIYSSIIENDEEYERQLAYLMRMNSNLFVSVYFGVNADILEQLRDYLQKTDGVPHTNRDKFIEDISTNNLNPGTARKLRKIVIRYKFFSEPPNINITDTEAVNNYNDQRDQYKRDVKNWEPQITAFFEEKTGLRFTE